MRITGIHSASALIENWQQVLDRILLPASLCPDSHQALIDRYAPEPSANRGALLKFIDVLENGQEGLLEAVSSIRI